jgi:hypothetical protein
VAGPGPVPATGTVCRRQEPLFLVAHALVLLRTAVEDASSVGVALEPGLTDLELAATLDRTCSAAAPSVLRHGRLTSYPSAQRDPSPAGSHYVVDTAGGGVRQGVGEADTTAATIIGAPSDATPSQRRTGALVAAEWRADSQSEANSIGQRRVLLTR